LDQALSAAKQPDRNARTKLAKGAIMAEENGAAAPQTAPAPIKMSVLAQFVRDMSFENLVAQKGLSGGDVQPDIQVAVSLDVRKRTQEHQFEVIQKFRVTSKNKTNNDTLFLLEVDYGGIFHVENVPEDQMHPFLLIECPRLLFPFVRRIISDVTRDGGFPALNIDTVDYMALYRQELARRQAATTQDETALPN
jgi:preprotein translocase subunit SecB